MKLFKKSLLILVSAFMSATLGACGKKDGGKKQKDPLVIPTVDVENLEVTLPDLPTYNEGEPRNDGTYDYIDLYEVSDFHGAVDFKESSSEAYPGLARMATYFSQKRAENPGGTILLSSGDMFQGSADSNSTRGYMVNYCMNYMGFDAMAIGNHEFDWTDTWIRKNANLEYNTRKIPYLGINIQDKRTNEMPDFCHKSTIVERGDYKIGIIGAIGSGLESSILYSCVENYTFLPEKELISAEAARLREEDGCDFVVLIEHQGIPQIPTGTGVDAIFGGHAHQNVNETIDGVPAVATKNYGRGIGHIQLKIDRNSKDLVYGAHGFDTFTNSDKEGISENEGIKAIMAEYAPSINSIKNIELGEAKDDLAFNAALKNICVKSMFDSANKSLKDALAAGEDGVENLEIIASFHNVNGGIRDDIRAGKITYGSVYSAFPFDNEIVLIKAKGTLLNRKMTNFTQLGVYRTFETSKDIISTKDYYIATTDFLALSDTGFNGPLKSISDADLIRTGAVVRDIVAERIYELDEIKSSDFPNSAKGYEGIPIVW